FSWQANSKLSFYSNSGLNYSRMSDRSGETGLERSGFNYMVYLGGNYKLPKDFRLSWNGSYNSPYISLQGKGSPNYYYGLNLTKSMLKRKLNITLNANSFIEKNKTRKSYTETATFRNENTSIFPARRIGISVSYTFGQMKEQIKKAQRSISNNDVKGGGGE
ncbi:MAG: TonB-dependent receptor, partial [Bacteroidetes bacterium]|nr:TonB-dependent receptor [Bacteroidota bacterium]